MLILFLVLLMVLLFPMAIYLLGLAVVNSRESPVVVSGPWDFAGVLLAMSGVILVVGPTVLSLLDDALRTSLLKHGMVHVLHVLNQHRLWLASYGLYLLLVVGGSFLVLRSRRAVNVVYNVDLHMVLEALGQALAALGHKATQSGNRVFIELNPEASGPRVDAASSMTPSPPSASAVLEIDPFPSLCNVAIRWESCPGGMRRDIEAEMARALDRMPAPDNPAAGLFMKASSAIFFLMLFCFISILVLQQVRG